MFEYKMIQVPPTIVVQGTTRGTEAAAYLQDIVNRGATAGWEFYRVDEIGIRVQPGCLGAFGGAKQTTDVYYVVTFRREPQSG